VLRAITKRIIRTARDDSGVAVLAIAAIVAIIAFSALSVFLNTYIGDRTFERIKGGSSAQSLLLPAVMANFYQQSPVTLSCPDTNVPPDGSADACNPSTTTTGVLPWITLGLSRDAVIDSYGSFYTYVVSAEAKDVCFSVGNDYTGADEEYTGSLLDATDLAVQPIGGASRNVAFVILSHGANGYGAIGSSGVAKPNPPAAHTSETTNNGATPSIIYTGPYAENVTDAFDDQVFAPSAAELQKACESLTPGQQLNAAISDNFETPGTAIDDDKFEVSDTNAPTQTRDANNNGVASFTDNESYLGTAATYNFNPTVRPVYVAALWTPNPSGTASSIAGMSIATRATLSDLTAASDIFGANSDRGITFRFYESAAGNIGEADGTPAAGVNHIYICDETTPTCTDGDNLFESTTTYELVAGETYLIEVYDNGSAVWMRITQRDDVTNTATATFTTTNDLTGDQRVFFINGPSLSYIDEVVVGLPMLALDTDGTGDVVFSAAGTNDFTGAAPFSLTLEAWINPRALPTTGNRGAIISRWATNEGTASNQSYHLFIDDAGTLSFEVAGDTGSGVDEEAFDFGFRPQLNEWTHIAIVFDAPNQTVSFYKDGVLVSTRTSAIDEDEGVNDTAARRFSVGGEFTTANAVMNSFNGKISDVRVWEVARTADQISDNFQRRLAAVTDASVDDLIVNWRFDNESGSAGGGEDVVATPSSEGINGDLIGNAAYTPALAVYFRPFSNTFCPDGTKVGPYQCDFRTTDTEGMEENFDIPLNLTSLYVKAWGAGGGAYDDGSNERFGAGGGYSAGLLQGINSNSIAGMEVDVYVGGYGLGSTSQHLGAGGGGGSGIFSDVPEAGLVAGGGGGASFSTLGTCSTATGTSQCGLGSGGGGAGGVALTAQAADEGLSCGGRGGDNGPFGPDDGTDLPPSDGGDCDNYGTNPTGQTGGGAGGGGEGGGPAALAGGSGDDPSTGQRVGGGGGGGGAIGGEAGGHGGNFEGFGGGGGSGTADAMGAINVIGAVGSTVGVIGFSDTAQGDLNGSGGSPSDLIDGISKDVIAAGWMVGYSITVQGAGPYTITQIVSQFSIRVSNSFTNSAGNRALVVTGGTATGSVPGGSTDPHYSPSYASGATCSCPNPGRGGAPTSVNGTSGAVVLIW